MCFVKPYSSSSMSGPDTGSFKGYFQHLEMGIFAQFGSDLGEDKSS